MAAVSEQAVAAAAAVVVFAAAAVVVVVAVAVVVVALVVAAASLALSPPGLWSSLSQGPRSWPRDSHPGRSPVFWFQPTRHLQLQIPEPSELLMGLSAADSALWCPQAEVALKS